MSIALSEEHESLRLTAQRWLAAHCPPSEPRAAAEDPAATLPPVWEKMAAQDWLGLHVAEDAGGQGFGLIELAVVLEELGAALFPARCCPRCWPRPSCPGSADPGSTRSCCRAWPTAPSRRRSCSAAAASTPNPPPAVPSGSAGRCARCSGCPGRGCSSCRSKTGDGSSSTVPAPTMRSGRRSSPGSTPPGPSPCSPSTASSYRRPSRSGPPTSSSAALPSCSARPRAQGSRAGASTRPRSTRRCGCSSAARSASSRRSSTRWPTCWSRWRVRRRGVGRRHGVVRRGRSRYSRGRYSRGRYSRGRRRRPTGRRPRRSPGPPRPPSDAPRTACRCWAASVTRGSTTPTCT